MNYLLGKDMTMKDRGKSVVIFKSQEHANLAFQSISGPVRPDNNNKPQKRVYLKAGGYLAVRHNY